MSSNGGVIASANATMQVIKPTPATHTWVNRSRRRRSTISASAPLGRPNRNTGSEAAVATSATITGEVVSVVISHAAATSFIHMQMFAVTQTPQSMRNTGLSSGEGAAGSGWGCAETDDIAAHHRRWRKALPLDHSQAPPRSSAAGAQSRRVGTPAATRRAVSALRVGASCSREKLPPIEQLLRLATHEVRFSRADSALSRDE